jgi:hypothetical protein
MNKIEALMKRADAVIEARRPPGGAPVFVFGDDGEDVDLVRAAHLAKHPEDVGRPFHFVTWLSPSRRPELCSRESVSECLPKTKARIAKASNDRSPATQKQARESEQHWRDLCARFGVDYDSELT